MRKKRHTPEQIIAKEIDCNLPQVREWLAVRAQ